MTLRVEAAAGAGAAGAGARGRGGARPRRHHRRAWARARRAHPQGQLPQRARRAAHEGGHRARSTAALCSSSPASGDAGLAQIDGEHRRASSDELRVEEGNITEPGETRGGGRGCAQRWADYQRALDAFVARARAPAPALLLRRAAAGVRSRSRTRADDDPRHEPGRDGAQERRRRRAGARVAGAAVIDRRGASRLRPRAPRVGGADHARCCARSSVLAPGGAPPRRGRPRGARARRRRATRSPSWPREFNTMAERLQQYRESSLGELLRGAARGAGGDRQPARSGAGVRRRRRAAQRQPRRRSRSSAIRSAGGDARRAPAPAVRERDRAGPRRTCWPATAPTCAARVSRRRWRCEARDGSRALLPAGQRRSTPTRGDCSAATVVLQDVTRLRRFDELKNDLVATVAHEFRTPLTVAAHGHPPLAEQTVGPLTEKQADLLSRRARTASGCRRSSTSCSTCRASRPGASSCTRARSRPSSLLRAGAARHPGCARQRQIAGATWTSSPGAGGGDGRSRADPARARQPASPTRSATGRPGGRSRSARCAPTGACASRSATTARASRPSTSAHLREVLPRPGRAAGRRGPRPLHRPRDRRRARRQDRRRRARRARAPRSGSRCRTARPASAARQSRRRPDLNRPTGRPRTSCACATASRRRCRGCARPPRASACGPRRAGCARARSARG